MLSPYLVLDLVIIVAFLVVGLLVVLRDSRPALNRLFAGFTVSVSAWILANYLSNSMDIPFGIVLAANHAALFFPGIALIFLLNFTLIMTHRQPLGRWWLTITVLSTTISLSALTNLVMQGIHRQGEVYAITFGPLSPLYFSILIILMSLPLFILALSRKHTAGEERDRLTAIMTGLSLLLVINVATNALLPALNNSFALTNIGPLSSAFLVYALWYSIVKHKLFDVRSVVARSLAYVLSLATLVAIFTLGAYALTSLLFANTSPDATSVRLVYTLLAVVLAFLLSPLRHFFDRVTNSVFFRDSYNSENFLTQFNKLVVAIYDLSPLLRKSADMVADTIKTNYVVFCIWETANTDRKLAGTNNAPRFSEHETKLIKNSIGKIRRKIIITDDLEAKNEKLSAVLKENNVGAIIRLTSSHSNNDDVGYLMIGDKKSGNSFTVQDINVLEIVANELVIAIQNALRFEEIENFNITLQARVDEATRKLRRTNEKLKELDEAKDDFVSMASHQLRTPLTSIKGYTSMVLEGDAGKINTTQRQLLEQSFFSSQRMVYLIADLLNVSRLKTGKFIIEPVPVNLAEVVQQEIVQLKETAEGRSLTLTYDMPEHFPSLMLDETKTRQVIMNFVDNAIYYTPAGGHIGVELLETPASVELRVTDNGIGVPKSEQPHLFTKFYRAGNARKARPDGTGLGLFMAKKVVVAEGGAIIFETEEGKGSTFGFVFSKSKLAPAS